MSGSDVLEAAYRKACETELEAFKPGNVSIYSAAHDMTVDDFRLSAHVSAPYICQADLSLGEKIFYAVKATREAVNCNTNLGIILLCAPIIQAFQQRQAGQELRAALHDVLGKTSQQDCAWVYKAIQLASPGGLGDSDDQDVHAVPEVTLTEAMVLAADRDLIARQYGSDFREIFDFTLLEYNCCLEISPDLAHISLMLYARLLEQYPDSHIQRKFDNIYDVLIAQKMTELVGMLRVQHFSQCLGFLTELDQWLKSNRINPGTTADMVVVTLLTGFLEQLIRSAK